MNFRTLLPLALAAATVACGPAPIKVPPVDSGVEEEDAGALPVADSGIPDAGGPVDAGAPCDRTDPCSIAWSEPERYPVVVDHHTSFIHEGEAGAFLYVLGGARAVAGDAKEVYPAVRRAKLKPDGSLEAWTDVGMLPTALGFAAQAVAGNLVYLVGGVSMDAMGPVASGKVMVGAISAVDGSISWKLGPALTEATLHGTAVVLDHKLYLIGGSAQRAKTTVLVSQLDHEGFPGPWTAAPALPQARSHHTAVVHEGRIFLIGGFDASQTPQSPILRSAHDATGALTGWTVAGDMPNSPWTAGASVWGQSLFVVGGGEGGSGVEMYVDRVRQARFLADNTVSGFADVTPLPAARSHVHQAPIYQGKVYSVGGRLFPSGNTMDRVFIGTFQ